MNKDNNFFIVIAITVCVLMFYPMLMKKIVPQYFPEPKQQTETRTYSNKYQPANIETKLAPVITSATYVSDKSYILRSNLFEVEVNGPDADIKSIRLVQIIDPDTKEPTILMDTANQMPGIFSDEGLVDSAVLQNVEVGENQIIFYYKNSSGLNISKAIRIDNDAYRIALEYAIENPSREQRTLSYRIISATGIKKASSVDRRFYNQITVFRDKKSFKKGLNNAVEKTIPGNVQLSGVMMRYFSLINVPLVTTDYIYSYTPGSDQDFALTAVGMGSKSLLVPAKETIRLNYVLYAGPNDQEQMSKLHLEVEQIRGKGLFAGLSDLMLLLLRVLHKLFHNYGLAVIGLALTINILLYPLTFKSLKSMKDMQALQPLIEQIRVKNKDNPQKLNKETMELYKKHKVNPAGGCLPMLLQMPIFFSLYGVLMRAIELRGAKFLWIQNLAAPDAFMSFPAKIPFVGSSLNILPLAMMVFSFLQQKATNTGQVNEQSVFRLPTRHRHKFKKSASDSDLSKFVYGNIRFVAAHPFVLEASAAELMVSVISKYTRNRVLVVAATVDFQLRIQ